MRILTAEDILTAPYTEGQKAAIESAIKETENTFDGFLTYTWSDKLVETDTGQRFAVFGHMARELLPFHDFEEDRCKEWVPVIVEGRLLERCPDEGRSGVAYLTPDPSSEDSWLVPYLPTGWLRTSELKLTPEGIGEKIVEEIGRGATHITGGRPGW